MLKVHAPVLAAAAFLWSTSAAAAQYYEVTLKGELTKELGYPAWDLNTGVDPHLAIGDIVTLTARFDASRALAQGGGFIAGLYGLPTSGDEFWRLDVGGLTWTSTDEMYDGFPIYLDDEAFYADPSITFASGKVTGVSGSMVPTWTDAVPVFQLAAFRIEPGEGLYGLPTTGDEFWRLDVGGLAWTSTDEMYDGFPIYLDDEAFYLNPSITFASGKVTGVSGGMVPTWTDADPVFQLAAFRIEPGEGLYGNTYNSQGFGGVWDYANSSITLSAVPEPAAWAIMIVGFGMTGAAVRAARRRSAPALA